MPLPLPSLDRSFQGKSVLFSRRTHLPELGGTNPYPLAPTITPLVSALFGGGPGGNSTGPEAQIFFVRCFVDVFVDFYVEKSLR